MNNLTVFIYYIYVIIIIALTGYVVFILNYSGLWFIIAFLFTEIRPHTKNDNK